MPPNPSPSNSVIPWRAQPGPQLTAIQHHDIDELFYGGAVGGGKSDFLLGDFAQDVPSPWGRHWRGILFRQSYGELEELITRSQEIYPPWFPGCVWRAADKTWEWPNGASLKMRYLESTADWMRYWGHQYTWIGWDELPNWVDMTAYEKMKIRLRSAHPVPNKRIRASGNPGGPGHHAVKSYFRIDQHPMGGVVFTENGMRRMFVRSRLSDNRILSLNDPKYAERLDGLSSDLKRALVDGDWNFVAGAYFDCWRDDDHVVRPFEIPEHWTKFRAVDWGSARPFSVGWWAIASETTKAPDGHVIPRDAMIRYREWYGAKEPNVGLKMRAQDVALGIKSRTPGNEKIAYTVCDPAMWIEDGGPSIAEMFESQGLYCTKADNKRIPGWVQVRNRLIGMDGKPMLYVFSTCTALIRTLPALQHSDVKPEDVDTDGEDHAPDEARYACQSRPWTAGKPTVKPGNPDDSYTRHRQVKRGNWKTA